MKFANRLRLLKVLDIIDDSLRSVSPPRINPIGQFAVQFANCSVVSYLQTIKEKVMRGTEPPAIETTLAPLIKQHIKNIKSGEMRALIILLHGPRGSGKTFIQHEARLLAKVEGLTVATESLAELEDMERPARQRNISYDGSLHFKIIAIDEVDRMLADDKDVGKIITLLDKYRRSPSIILMTTNDIEKIRKHDSTILRPGRVDYIVEYNGFTKEQAELYLKMYGVEWDHNLGPLPLKPAELEHYVYTGRYEKVQD